MCDTLGRIAAKNKALFAKNSDRSPNEPQVTEYYQAKSHDEKILHATYTDVEQVSYTFAVLLSRPAWMWGAEMGVNECGVCIGNEAVFTRGKYEKGGLTGMDLVRLGLERGVTAREALHVIIDLLERYGQGGDCGYDHTFYYDNSFLIMDTKAVYILETAGKEWVCKKVKSGSISNQLAIGTDGDAYRGGTAYNFTARHKDPLYTYFSGSGKRLAQTQELLQSDPDVGSMMDALRIHRDENDNHLTHADVASPCMHAGGLVGDHTTASMVVEIKDEITVWLTGCSTPCISLFKPWRFGNEPIPPVFSSGNTMESIRYWLNRENFHRSGIGQVLPEEFFLEKLAIEDQWLKQSEGADQKAMNELSRLSVQTEIVFYDKWIRAFNKEPQGKRPYLRYWDKKTEILKTPAKKILF